MFARHRLVCAASQAVTLLAWRLDRGRGQNFVSSAPQARVGNRSVATATAPLARRRALSLASGAVALSALPILGTVAFVLGTQSWSATAYPTSFWQARLDWTLRPAVRDSTQALVGFIPPATNPGKLESSHAATAAAIPDACVNLVLAREDAHHADGWRYLYGVDLFGLAWAAVTRRRGASTLPMQLSRQLAPEWFQQSTYARKALEIGAAATVLQMHGGDARAVARTYLSIAPMGVAYGDVRGIAAAADIFFGARVPDLSPAQCSVLVTFLAKRPKLTDNTAQASQAWLERRAQAVALVHKVMPGQASSIQREIETWTALPIRSAIAGKSEAVTLNLGARTRAYVLPHLARMDADMRAPDVGPLATAQDNRPRNP